MSERLEVATERMSAPSSCPLPPRTGRPVSRSGGKPLPPAARRFARGDSAAVRAASEVARKVVWFRGYYIPPEERADVVQDTLVDVVRALPSSEFRTDDEFHAFVRTVGHRRCVDWMRHRRRQQRLNPETVRMLLDPGDRLLARERRRLATEAVSLLKDSCRDLFALHVHGMTYGELARRYGRTEGALRTQAYQCLEQARRLFKRLSRGPA